MAKLTFCKSLVYKLLSSHSVKAVPFATIVAISIFSPVTPAEGQVAPVYSPVDVQTDKNSYETGDIIILTGSFSPGLLTKDEPSILIQVFSPSGAMVRADPVNVAADGRFSDSFPVSGIFNVAGEYQVVATYKGQYQGETTFSYEGQTIVDHLCAITVCTYPLNIDNKTYPINYRITGVLNNITADYEKKSLKIDVSTQSQNAVLLIALPRDVIDAVKEDGEATTVNETRTAFTVLVDGEPGRQSEQGSKDVATQTLRIADPEGVRILAIDLTRESKQIEIVGTWLVPEFSSGVAAVILVGAVSGILWYKNARYLKSEGG